TELALGEPHRAEQLDRIAADEPQATAELARALHQRHGVPAPRRRLRRRQARRPAADDDHAAGPQRGQAPLRLSPYLRVVEARDRLPADHPVDAALIGADARADRLPA